MFDEILTHKEYSVLGAGEPLREVLGAYFLLFQKQKQQRGIKSRVIIAKKYKSAEVATKTFGKVKFIDDYEAPTTTYVFGSKVALILCEPTMAIVIQSKQVSMSFKNYFELMWQASI